MEFVTRAESKLENITLQGSSRRRLYVTVPIGPTEFSADLKRLLAAEGELGDMAARNWSLLHKLGALTEMK